jgi:multidrug efflux pump subunit AcrA (membrane-fusion protein)
LILALSAIVVGGVWGVYAWATAANTHVAGAEHGSRNGKASLGFVAADEASRSGDSAATRRETVPVEVVQRNHTLRVTGTMMADEKSAVVANVSGIVAEVRVDRGSVVRKGDLLVQLDPTDAKNKLAEGRALLEELKSRLGLGPEAMPQTFKAEEQPEVKLAGASLALAEANLKRADKLLSQRAMAAEAYEQTQTERELAVQRYDQAVRQMRQAFLACKTAQFRLAILEKAVADTAILAPFDGLVAEKLVSVGEQISSGMQATKVVTLVRIDPLRLSLTVPQNDVGHVRQGQKVRFQVDSFPDRTFEGTVRFISPVVTNDTRSLVVEAVVPNAEATLRPGLFATAQLVLAEQQAGIYVPAGAVQKMEEVARVFVVREGVAREQVVALGEQNPQKVEIKSGLSGKELLVARPDLVRDGDLVR